MTNTNPEARVVEAVARVRARLGILADESHWPDYVDEARELISAHTKALAAEGKVIEDDWRPIDSAPKDGTPVELFSPQLGADDPWNVPGGLIWVSGGYGKGVLGVWRGDHGKNPPTHWRPLRGPGARIPTPTLPPAGDER